MKRRGVRRHGLAWIIVTLLVCVESRGWAETEAVAASLDAPVLSAYVWRGQVLNNEAVLQPSLTMTKGAFSLCPSVSVGVGFGTDQYNKGYFGVNKAAFNDLTFTGSVGCTLANNLTLSPMVQYVALLDGEIRDAAQSRYQDDCQVVGSVKLTYTF